MANENDTTSYLKDTRLALTFLDTKHYPKSVNDELMIDKQSNELAYKQKDGTIVVPTAKTDAHQSVIVSELNSAIKNIASTMIDAPDTPEAVLIARTYDIHDAILNRNILDGSINIKSVNIAEDDTRSAFLSFPVSKKSNYFFVNIKTRKSDAGYVEILTSMYDSEREETDTNATITYTIKYSDVTGHSIVYTREAPIRLNNLWQVPIPTEKDLKNDPLYMSIGEITSVEVTIVTVMSEVLLFSADPSIHQSHDPFRLVINDDGKVLIDYIEVKCILDSYADMLRDNVFKNHIDAVVPYAFISNEVKKVAGLSPDEKDNIAELTRLVHARAGFFYSTTRPANDVFKTNDVWACPTEVYELDTSGNKNVILSNLTFNKDEMEKFLFNRDEYRAINAGLSFDENDKNSVLIK